MSNPYGKITNGILQPVRFEPRGYNGGPIDANTIAIEMTGGEDAWVMSVYADVGRGTSLMGRLITMPWSRGLRTVAYACHPGARAWEVTAEKFGYSSQEDSIGVLISSTNRIGGEWGLKTIDGMSAPFCARWVMGGYGNSSGILNTRSANVVRWTASKLSAGVGRARVGPGSAGIYVSEGTSIEGPPVLYHGFPIEYDFQDVDAWGIWLEEPNPPDWSNVR